MTIAVDWDIKHQTNQTYSKQYGHSLDVTFFASSSGSPLFVIKKHVFPGKFYFSFMIFTEVIYLSYDVASGSEITPCNEIDKPLVVYRFTGKS